MINLLPHELKEEYRYARYNRRLLKWASAFVVAILGVCLLATGGVIIMNHSSSDYKVKIAKTKTQLAEQDLEGTQKQITEVSNNLKLMVNVLSKEVLFSKLLAQLGTITPQNVILTDLSISQTESAMNITANTVNYEAATQLQANLADANNKIFSKADLVSINCPAAATDKAHPCTAVVRALFTKNNPYLFINSNKAGS